MNILFISHDASRTGAPILLMNFLKYLKEDRPDIHFGMILRTGGVLEEDFKELGKVFFFKPTILEPSTSIISKVFQKIKGYQLIHKIYLKFLLVKLKKQKFDLIYSNTVVNTDVLEFLLSYDVPKIAHIRELSSTIDHFGGDQLMSRLKSVSSFFIADSYAVKNNLIQKYDFSEEKVQVVHEFIPTDINFPDNKAKGKIKASLGIPNDAIVIGASGSGIWRKGPDLFLQVAVQLLNSTQEDLYFVWTGHFSKGEMEKIQYDVDKLGIGQKVIFPGAVSNPLDYYSIFDIFLLTSREEPFGIVALEVSMFEIPSICFDKVGGLPEYIQNDAGIVVPYLHTKAMAEAVASLIENPDIRKKLGAKAKKRTMDEHNIEKATRRIIDTIEKQLQ